MIRSLFALFALTFFAVGAASADTRAVYTIRDIPVDETAPTVIEAQQKAFDAARYAGARRLFNKLTLSEDRTKAGGISMDMELARRLVIAVDVQEEARGGGRYRGVLSVVVNPQVARAHLQTLGIPYVDRQAPLGLLMPVASAEMQSEWMSAWRIGNPIPLAPYKTSIVTYDRNADWTAIQEEIAQTNTHRGIVAELLSRNRVRMTLVTASGRTGLGTTGAAADMETAIERASSFLDGTWKQESIIRTTLRTVREAEILYTSLSEWNKLRGALVRSPLVSDFKINAIARDGAAVTFAYAGDDQRLERDLRQRGVALDTDPTGWLMTSAITSGQ